jgi:hypothetical protein
MTSHALPPLRDVRFMEPVVVRRSLAVLVGAHGFAHLVGTIHAFSRAANGRSLDYLAGNWTVSDPTTMRVLGVAWAVMVLAFLATGAAMWIGRSQWPLMLWWASLGSLMLTLIALWASVVGAVVNLSLLVIAWRAGAIAHTRGHV